jgi:hypothetical protein
MEEIVTTSFVILGFMMRLALPFTVTALLVWLLRRLDLFWQREASVQEQPAEAANQGCWDVQHCSDKQRASCQAYSHQNVPCWQYYRQQEGRLREACLGCKVFQEAPLPVVV